MTWLLLSAAILPVLGQPYMGNRFQLHEDVDLAAARIALHVLTLDIGRADTSWRFIIGARGETVSLDRAVEALADVSKPTRCRAHLGGEKLAIVSCDSLTDERSKGRQVAWASRWLVELEGVLRDCQTTETNPPVEMVIGETPFVFSFSAVQTWLRDYFMPYQIDIAPFQGRRPTLLCMTTVTIRPGGTFLIVPDSEP